MKPLQHTIATLCAVSLLTAIPAWAQTDAAKPGTTTTQAGTDTKKQFTGKLVKGAEILGANIFNQKADDLGEISDLLLDENTGNISHAVLDLGTNLVAVPYKRVKQSEKDTQGYVVDVDKTKLDGAPHFADNAWPNFDDAWMEKSYSYYGVTGKKGVKLVRLSKVHGSKLFDQAATHIGEIKNTLVHPNSGKVAYGVVSLNTPAVGDKQTTVPFKLIRESKEATPGFVVNVDKAKLTNAVYFDANSWPDYNDYGWNDRTYGYYGVGPYWTTPGLY